MYLVISLTGHPLFLLSSAPAAPYIYNTLCNNVASCITTDN
jgi:hypothetical protein